MAIKPPRPAVIQLEEAERRPLKITAAKNPRPNATLGDIGIATRVSGPTRFPPTLLLQPVAPEALVGLEPTSLRVFRFDGRSLRPHWNSGLNVALGFVWAKIERPGTYVPIGLPRDRLVQAALAEMAERRRYAGADSAEAAEEITLEALRPLLELPLEEVEELRSLLTRLEAQTAAALDPRDVRPGRGGHLLSFPLPGDSSLEEFRERLERLAAPADGLPEEALLAPPELLFDRDLPWPSRPGLPSVEHWLDKAVLERFSPPVADWLRHCFPWFWSRNWWMYQHDVRHTGHASGWSSIRSTSVGTLTQLPTVNVDGPMITKPSIVDGKIYIGSGKYAGIGGTLYKIDLATGTKEGEFPAPGFAYYPWYQGIGGSPAVTGGRVYFTAVHGKVYCIDAATMTPGGTPHPPPLWVTDLKHADPTKNQPVNQPDADSWTSPLVVNGRVYIGCGEGESAATYGFVFCLDAATGKVIWCFCTAKFQNRHAPGLENAPNVIPASVAISDPLPAWATAAGFTLHRLFGLVVAGL
jgi:hypothetical protein